MNTNKQTTKQNDNDYYYINIQASSAGEQLAERDRHAVCLFVGRETSSSTRRGGISLFLLKQYCSFAPLLKTPTDKSVSNKLMNYL